MLIHKERFLKGYIGKGVLKTQSSLMSSSGLWPKYLKMSAEK
ncbi:hypothetical protein DBT_0861 [Dissulfuribacter thermophilus]|uniref:Uncharacterized protein n=1 Tax=Dissulfuribacter thermophilus TaxID=1156395 RepID=A0A1B9F7N9_9BACT|nr:hypothetical protein DBT_0861 [Dissulfuribacter thermophilus]